MRDAEKTVGNILDKSGTVHIGSVDENGFPNVKAMYAPRIRDGIKILYFSTNTSSLRVEQFRKNPHACVYFMDKRFFCGVMLKGIVEILVDTEIKKSVWRDGDEKYYTNGIEDEDYCVLKFTSICGRYYSNYKSVDFDIN